MEEIIDVVAELLKEQGIDIMELSLENVINYIKENQGNKKNH